MSDREARGLTALLQEHIDFGSSSPYWQSTVSPVGKPMAWKFIENLRVAAAVVCAVRALRTTR